MPSVCLVLIGLIAQGWHPSSLFGKMVTGAVKIEKANVMTAVEKIQSEIETLSPEEYEHLRLWFFERDWEQWDRQIEQDAASGKLDFLIEEALAEKAQGQLKEL